MSLLDPFARLVREHEAIAGMVAAARAASEAAVQYRDENLVPGMLVELHALHTFMGRELAAHIAREEDILFPALRALTSEDRLIDELLVQHDRVHERRALLESVLTSLDHHHDDVTAEHARLGASLEAQPSDCSWEALGELAESVRQLDWILQGHFGDEEDDLFAPGAALFSPADLERMTQEMYAINPDR